MIYGTKKVLDKKDDRSDKPNEQEVQKDTNTPIDETENDTFKITAKKLGKVLDETILTYDESGAFLMSIEDIYTITGNTVVTGKIKRGTLKIGDSIEVVGLNDKIMSTTVIKIEAFRKKKDTAKIDDYVGVTISGLKEDDLKVGQVLSKPSSIVAGVKFDADIKMLTKEEGGRHTPAKDKDVTGFYLNGEDIRGQMTFPKNKKELYPGDSSIITVELENNSAMEVGYEFTIREGGRIVANGKITKIY